MPGDFASGKRWDLRWKPMKAEHGYLKIIIFALRLVLGGTFIYASGHKIAAPDQFAKILYGYGVFPGKWINLMAICLPFVELLAGICLIAGRYKRSALIIINAMLLGFILLISFNLLRGYQFDCGCFSFGSTHDQSSAVGLLVRDLGVLGAGIWVWTRLTSSGKNSLISS
ncbi:MAG: DoxX family membrane protein [Desulfobacter sp.]|nr:DoxX family membrane protein [Desulfobacter sp.]